MKLFIRILAWLISITNIVFVWLFIAQQLPDPEKVVNGFYILNLYSILIVTAITWQGHLLTKTGRPISSFSMITSGFAGITFILLTRTSEAMLAPAISGDNLVIIAILGLMIAHVIYTLIATLFEEDHRDNLYQKWQIRVNRLPNGNHFDTLKDIAKVTNYHSLTVNQLNILNSDLDDMQVKTDHMINTLKKS
jgi:hypothetical protein